MKRLLIASVLIAAVLLGVDFHRQDSHRLSDTEEQKSNSEQEKVSLEEELETLIEPKSQSWTSYSIKEIESLDPPEFVLPHILLDSLQCRLPELESIPLSSNYQFKEVKNIRPPFPNIQVPHEVVTISHSDLKLEQKLKFKDGAELSIPANALCLEDGSPVNEPVQIAFMPLDNAFDVMLSGIPMTYDSADARSLFQTAGMFRLEAKTSSEKAVKLKAGQSMKIAMPTVDEGGRYNDYRFDEQEGKWVFQSGSAAPMNIMLTNQNGVNMKPVNEMFYDPDYAYTYNLKDRRSTSHLCVNHRRNHMGCRVYEPYRISPKRIKTVYFRTSAIRAKEGQEAAVYFTAEKPDFYWAFNPEWRAFQHWNFKAKDITALQDFRKKYKVKKRYNDLRLVWEGGNEVLLLLKHTNGIDSLWAEAWDSNYRYAKGRQRSFARKYKRYVRDLKNRELCHDRYVSTLYGGRGFGLGGATQASARQMDLPGFGIYNCDRTYIMASPKSYRALKYVNAEGVNLNPLDLLVLDDLARGAFFLGASDFKACSKGTTTLLVTGSDSKMYACSGKHLYKKGSYSGGKALTMHEVPEELNNYESLQNWLESLNEE